MRSLSEIVLLVGALAAASCGTPPEGVLDVRPPPPRLQSPESASLAAPAWAREASRPPHVVEPMVRATLAETEGRWSDARALFATVVDHETTDVPYLVSLARNFHAEGLPGEAAELLVLAARRHAHHIDIIQGAGEALLATGDLDSALVYFHQAASMPGGPEARRRTGAALLREGHDLLALDWFRPVAIDEVPAEQTHALARAALRQQQHERALELLDLHLTRQPGDALAHLDRGRALILAARLPEAQQALGRATRAGTVSAARVLLGHMALSAGRVLDATRQYGQALDEGLDPFSLELPPELWTEALVGSSRRLTADGHLESAAVLLDAARALGLADVDRVRTQLWLEQVPELDGRLVDQRIQRMVLDRSTDILAPRLPSGGVIQPTPEGPPPRDVPAVAVPGLDLTGVTERNVRETYMRASLHEARREWAQARELYREVSDADPDRTDALLAQARTFHGEGLPWQATDLILEALAARGQDPRLLLAAGRTAAATGDPMAAVDWFRRAGAGLGVDEEARLATFAALAQARHHRDAVREIEFVPLRHLPPHLLLAAGRAALVGGLGGYARDALGTYVRLEPDHADAWLDLARAHLVDLHLGDARAALQRALILAPRDPRLHVLLGHVFQFAEQPDAALVAYESALQHGADRQGLEPLLARLERDGVTTGRQVPSGDALPDALPDARDGLGGRP